MFRHLLIVPLVNHRLRVERLHADYSIMIEFGDYLQCGGGSRGLLGLMRWLAGSFELRLIEGETFLQGVGEAPGRVLGQDGCNDLILHLSH